MNDTTIAKARHLRRQHFSIAKIAKQLHVSPNKVNRWVTHIHVPRQKTNGKPRSLTPEQETQIAQANQNGTSRKVLATQYGLHVSTIGKIIQRSSIGNSPTTTKNPLTHPSS